MHMHFGGRESHVRSFAMVETGDLRRRMERAIESLIAALDALDGDADFEAEEEREPDPDFEPTLGGADDDRELDCVEVASW